MRRHVWAFVVALSVALVSGTALADHFDGDPATGTFNPQMTVAISSNVVNRPSTTTIDVTQQDHEDPPVIAKVRFPGDWQFAFSSTRQGETAASIPTTSCEATISNLNNSPNGTGTGTQLDYSKRTDAYFSRAEKIGTGHLEVHADGISRPGSPIVYNGDAAFISYDGATAKLCFLLITQDPRVTTLPDDNPDPSDTKDGIEGVTELVAEFPMTFTGSAWEAVADLTDLVKNETLQTLNVSLLNLNVVLFGQSVGNWNPGSVAISKTPQVSGTKTFEGEFTTCPPADPAYLNCKSSKPPVTRTIPKTIILPAPTITGPAAGSVDNDGTVTISGTSDALAQIEVVENGAAIGSTTADASGAWFKDIVFPEGSHTVTAKTLDAGGSSVASNPRTFSVDTPPAPPSFSSPSNGAIVGAGSIPLSGNAQPLSTVKIYEGSLLATTTANALGAWSTNVNITSKGLHTLAAKATDGGGEGAGTSLVLDVTTAVPVVIAPAEGAAFPDTTVALSGTAEPGSTVEIFENNLLFTTAVAGPGGAWSVNETFSEAEHVITARATSSIDGLVSPPTLPRTFEVDLTAPNAPLITAPSDMQEVGSATLRLEGTSEPGATILLSENGAQFAQGVADAAGNWSIPAQLSIDTHTAVAVARDKAGNLSGESASVTFIVVQSILIATPDQNSYQPKLVTVSGVSDPSSTLVKIYAGANPPPTATPIGQASVVNGSWSTKINFTNGTKTITARSVIAGNLSPLSEARTFIVDGSGPTVTVTKPQSSGLAIMLPGDMFEGTASDAFSFDSGVKSVTVSYFNAAGSFLSSQLATCTGCNGPNATWTVTPNVAPGLYGVQVRALDRVGNVSSVVQLIVLLVK